MGNIVTEAQFTVTATEEYTENNLTIATFGKHRQT
jgi:hypothetical protein